jgi:hypothetical protein
MHIFRRHQLPQHGADRPGKNLDVGPPRQFADLAGVLLGPVQRHIARHRRDAQHVQLRRGQRQQMATASSWPGSVSMMMGSGMAGLSCPVFLARPAAGLKSALRQHAVSRARLTSAMRRAGRLLQLIQILRHRRPVPAGNGRE